jgi:hypothetical protein
MISLRNLGLDCSYTSKGPDTISAILGVHRGSRARAEDHVQL